MTVGEKNVNIYEVALKSFENSKKQEKNFWKSGWQDYLDCVILSKLPRKRAALNIW